MIPVLVLTHGNLATELLQAAQTIDPSLKERTAPCHCRGTSIPTRPHDH